MTCVDVGGPTISGESLQHTSAVVLLLINHQLHIWLRYP